MPMERRGQLDRRHEMRGGRRLGDKLACPFCGCLQSAVVQHAMNAAEQRTEGYWRRRSCVECGQTFPTIEVVALGNPPVSV